MRYTVAMISASICLWLLTGNQLWAQQTLYFKNGRVGLANEIAFKPKTIVITSFDNPRAPLQEIPKNFLERIILISGDTLTSTDIDTRRTPDDQLDIFIRRETKRFAADDGSPRPVAFGSSNFLGKSITLTRVHHTPQYTILTFVRRQSEGFPFIISSATYLYNRSDVRQAFRIVNAGEYNLDAVIRVPASSDSLQYSLTFERVPSDLETVNFRSIPIAAGYLGGPVGGFVINDLALPKSAEMGLLDSSPLPLTALAERHVCITCGNNQFVRCPTCAGTGTIEERDHLAQSTRSSNRNFNQYRYRTVTCPVCTGAGRYLCPNRPNHLDLP